MTERTDGKDPQPNDQPTGISRRGFMQSWGAGSVALVLGPAGVAAPGERNPATGAREGARRARLKLEVNGRTHEVFVEPRWTLLTVLREQLGLTAAKPGCERGECGACTVLIDDRPRYACLTLAVEAEGHRVETAEGLVNAGEPGRVQLAFAEEDGLQCGYCTPGQVMAAEGLLRANPTPSPEEIRLGMSGNLCRCGAYPHIAKAVARASDDEEGAGG